MSKNKPLRADLHIHTFYSGDNRLKPAEIIAKALERKLDVLGITDHNTTRGALETRKLAAKKARGLLVLAGQEVLTKQGEILVFGLEKSIKKGQGLVETCQEAKKKGGFIIPSHPFDISRCGTGKHLEEILQYIDAIEVFNSRSLLNRFNKKAIVFAREHGLPMVAASDAHIPGDIGNTLTLIDSKPQEKAVYAAIKKGKTELVAGKAGFRRRFRSFLANKTKNTVSSFYPRSR
jgi:predicted metal-dependent phosphoesterase TrpH